MALQDVLPVTADRLSGYERVRIDAAQTSFFEGREFRVFKEFNIAASGTYLLRLVPTVNIIVTQIRLQMDEGNVRFTVEAQGTTGGTFSETVPVIGVNGMTAAGARRKNRLGQYYASQVTATAGGTLTGSTVYDVIRLKTNNVSNLAASIGNEASDEQATAPIPLFYRLVNQSSNSAATGVLNIRWQEWNPAFFEL